MKSIKEKFKNLVRKRPITLFLLILTMLFTLIFMGNKLRAPKEIVQKEEEVQKEVSIFDFQEVPRVLVQAEIQKKNVVTLVAQKNGIVSSIYFKEGQRAYCGNTLAFIADNQQGGSISNVALQIARKQNETIEENFERQKDIIKKEKKVIHNTEASTRAEKIGEDIQEEQLKIDKENLESSRDVSQLSLNQAQITESLARIMAPQNGTVERIYVRTGQFVTAGTPIALFSGGEASIQIEARVSADIASSISSQSPTFIEIQDRKIEAVPFYISKEATNDFLYSVIFNISKDFENMLTDGDFVSLSIPLESSISEDPFKPLILIDAVQITQEKSFVFILENGLAKSREVRLGNVFGQFVEVVSGLEKQDQIILNRNVFDGDRVTFSQ